MDSLKQAIEVSESILRAIEQGDLEKVVKLEKTRGRLIDGSFQNSEITDAELTLKLKKINDLIVDRLGQLQQKVRTTQMDLLHGSKASKAYLDIAK